MTGPDIFALLSDDHRKVEQLFEQFQQTNDPAVVLELCDEITAHSMAEEEVLYGVLATKVHPGLAQDARSEHAEAKRLIGEIEATLSSGGDIAPIVGQLQETMQHHVEEEESKVFPMMREKVPTAIGEMGRDFEERKKVLLSQVRDTRDAGAPSGTVTTVPPTAGIT